MLFWFADPVTVIKASEQQCSGPRRWGSITISLQEFHQVAKALGHTLNTLAVSCLAGGVRRYLQRHGQHPARRIRMCGMVDTRSMPGLNMHGASNNFSFIGVPLYTGDISAVERLERVGRAMSWIRHSVVVPIAIRIPDLIQVGTSVCLAFLSGILVLHRAGLTTCWGCAGKTVCMCLQQLWGGGLRVRTGLTFGAGDELGAAVGGGADRYPHARPHSGELLCVVLGSGIACSICWMCTGTIDVCMCLQERGG